MALACCLITGELLAQTASTPSPTGLQYRCGRHGHYPRWLHVVVSLLLTANTINIAGDIAAMGEATSLLVGGHAGRTLNQQGITDLQTSAQAAAALKPIAGNFAFALFALAGIELGFTPMDPIKALYWSAVLNGVISVPVMAVVAMFVTL